MWHGLGLSLDRGDTWHLSLGLKLGYVASRPCHMSHKLNLDLNHVTLGVKHKPKSCHMAPRLDGMAFRLSLWSSHVALKPRPCNPYGTYA
jgi:hypothetical protein